jgi:putative tricarboxylic transport membrane protein
MRNHTRAARRLVLLGVASLATVALAACAPATTGGGATESPSVLPRSIELVVPGDPGGGGDVLARQLAKSAEAITGSRIIVVNKPGAGGQTALQYCVSQPADGSCVVHVSRSVITLNPYISESRYTYQDVQGVFRVQIDPTYIAVGKDSPYKTIDDLITAAKKGDGALTIVSGAVGSVEYVLVKQLEQAAGFTSSYVPYEGGSTVGLDLAGGHSEVGIINASDNLDLITSGQVRLLAVARPERTDIFPDVPTLAESGYDVGDLDQWRGFVVPKDVPSDVVDTLHALFTEAIGTDDFKAYQKASGLLPGVLDQAEFNAMMKEQSAAAQTLFKKLGVGQ